MFISPCPSPGDAHQLSHRSQLPPGQPLQTAGPPRGGARRPFLIQAQLALWHGQIGLSPCTSLRTLKEQFQICHLFGVFCFQP